MRKPICQSMLQSMLLGTVPLLMLMLMLAQVALAGDPTPTDLVVAKNQTYRIGVPQLQLQRLELQDGAVISFAAGIKRALIHAEHVVIGKGVRIDATGTNGVTGAAGSRWLEPAPACEQGKDGGNGGVGGAGDGAIDLIVELGVERIGSLRIDANGGVGGKGGDGGDGQRGGNIERCYGKDGGNGGNGGDGGIGGNGGAVTLRYWINGSGLSHSSQATALTAADLVNAFSISVRGGSGGASGGGGAGGGVVEGRYLSTSVGSGKKWLGAGDAGKAGGGGRAGNAGAAGSVSLMQQNDDAPAATLPVVTKGQQISGNLGAPDKAGGPAADMRALRARIDALEERVKALESSH